MIADIENFKSQFLHLHNMYDVCTSYNNYCTVSCLSTIFAFTKRLVHKSATLYYISLRNEVTHFLNVLVDC